MAKRAKRAKSEPVRAKMYGFLRRKDLTPGTEVFNIISNKDGKVVRRPNAWVVFVRVDGRTRYGGVVPWSLRNVRRPFDYEDIPGPHL